MHKSIIQLSLILIICILSYIFYKFFLNTPVSEIILPNNIDLTIKQKEINKKSNVEELGGKIEKLSYFSEDLAGNQYSINAQSASSEIQNNNNTLLAGVTAEINFVNKDKLLINSKFAEYNQLSNNTVFKENVNIIHSIYKINSDIVNFNFENNLIEIYGNIVFKSANNTLYADKVALNLITKNLKILMHDEKDDILVTGNIPE
jgi:lipopolysaccharide export system protein LptA